MTLYRAFTIIGGTLLVLLMAATFAHVAGQTRVEMVVGNRLAVIDGDTVILSCEPKNGNRFSAQSTTNPCPERIRIYNIDAPEIGGARCQAERDMGLEARDALARLLESRSVTIHRCEPETNRCADRYGRTLARLETAAGDVGAAMIAAGKALPWQPGPEAHDSRAAIFCGR